MSGGRGVAVDFLGIVYQFISGIFFIYFLLPE